MNPPHEVRKLSQSSGPAPPISKFFFVDQTQLGDQPEEPASLMGDLGGTGDSRESPLQRAGSRAPGSDAHSSTRASSAAIGRLDSGASSPLLQTEMMPEEDGCVCPYCHRDYRKPRVLDCLHSMCEDCIIAQLDGRRDKARELEKRIAATDCVLQERASNDRPTPPGVIKCPTCAQESHVGNDIRFVHSMLIDFVRNAASGDTPAERNCRSCKSDLPAVAYCRQCGTDLCPNCLQAHKDMRMFEGHEVMSYDELEKTGRAGEVRRVLCPAHGLPYLVLCAGCEALACRRSGNREVTQWGTVPTVLCAGCEALACRNCLDSEHHSHKIVDVTPVVVKAISNELVLKMENVSNKWSVALESWHSEADRASTLMMHFENAKATIDFAYEEAARVLEASRLRKHAELEEARMRKHAELEEARDRQEETIEEVYRKVDVTQMRIDGAIKFSNRLLDSANGVELLASRKKVLHQLNSLEHTMPSLHTESELRFAPVMKKTLEATLRNAVGDIISQALPSSVSAMSLDGGGSTITRISASESEWAAVNGMKEARGDGGGLMATMNEQRGGGGRDDRSDVGLPPGGDRGGPGSVRGGGASSSLATSTITPIGGERAARAKAGVAGGVGMQAAAAAAAFAGGWPPSSNPPELPSPSPPKDQQQQLQTATSVAGGQVVALPQPNAATAAALQHLQQQAAAASAAAAAAGTPTPPAGLPPAWAAALAGNPAAAADPRLAGSKHTYPAADGEWVALKSRKIASNAAAAAAGSDQAILAAGLGKNVHEIKLAFAHGTGSAGNSIRELHSPGGFAVADNDEILIADTNNHRIVVITPSMPWKFGRPGQEDGQLCFPRRVVAMKGFETARYVVIDKAVDNKSRAQLFGATGEFIRRINLTAVVPKGGIEVWAATSTPTGHLVMVDQSSVIYTLDIKEEGVEPLNLSVIYTLDIKEPIYRMGCSRENLGVIYTVDIKEAQPRVVNWVDASNHLMEASDVAVHEKSIYVTDFRGHGVHVFSHEGAVHEKSIYVTDFRGHGVHVFSHEAMRYGRSEAIWWGRGEGAVHEKSIYVTDFRGHGVHVFSHEGTYLRKIGEPSHTPFPIGIDVARSGELLIAHTHGNKLTIVCYSPEGALQHQFVNCDFRMSRCAALRCTSTGHIVTLSKHAHTLYGFRRIMSPRS
uniref:Nhl-2 n=1 Tax=Pristionchus pacificus TaxID=54126 RepID=A0A2A6CHS7_PRIPA|eukprot:PDM77613.1 nhl-2 [Pristionchus pacificus]